MIPHRGRQHITSRLAAIERKLAVAVARFDADPESETWAAKIDEYDREKREAVKELTDVRAEPAARAMGRSS